MGKTARRVIEEKYDWQIIRKSVLSLYEDLVRAKYEAVASTNLGEREPCL
jgi:hypothetical protein